MTVKTFFQNVASFIGKYGTEVSSIGTALETLIDNLPIPKTDAAKVRAVIEGLQTASDNIQAALPKLIEGAKPVQISAKDIEAAVAKVAGPLIEKAVADALAKQDDGK